MHDTRIIDMIHLYDPKTATTKIARALVDSGATHEAMSRKYVTQARFETTELPQKRSVTGFSGHESVVTHSGDYCVNNNNEETTFIITELRDKYDVILGMPWIRRNLKLIDWEQAKLKKDEVSEIATIATAEAVLSIPTTSSKDHVLRPKGNARFSDEGVESRNSSLIPPQCEFAVQKITESKEKISNQDPLLNFRTDRMNETHSLDDPKTSSKDHGWKPERDARNIEKGVEFRNNSQMPPQSEFVTGSKSSRFENIGKQFSPCVRYGKTGTQWTVGNGIKSPLTRSMIDAATTSWNVSTRLAVEASKDKIEKSAAELVPECYHEYLGMFEKANSNVLPPHRPYDFRVDLVPGATPQSGRIIPLSPKEAEVSNEMLDKGLANGTLRRTTSPWAAPVLFTGKKDGNLRPCFDYRKLNAVTVKNKYPLPLTMELVDSLLDADRFTSLDMRNGYNNLRVREGDEAKLAFTCKAGQFEPLTMPFGPTGAPGFFQFFIQDILKAHIGRDVAAYQDDILIYTKPGVDYEKVVKEVLKILQKQNVWLKPEKCKFSQKEVAYLGLIISKNQIKMDETKVKAVKEWPAPKNLSEVLTFLGFSNFYRRFIHQFSKIARPLHELSKDNVKFEWTKERNDAFESLKKAFTTAPILTIANPYKPFILECDCSDFALGAVLSQVSEEDNELHPVAYLSRSLIKAERNYEVFDKELLAVISAFKEWRHYLEGNPHRLNVIVYTDHKNLESLMTTKELTRRQARWAEILGSFDFEIRFRPGKQLTKPDALSRRPDLKPEAGDKLSFGRLLKEENLPSDAFIDCLDGIEEWFEKESVMNCEIEAFMGPEEMWTDDAIIDEIKTKSAEDVKINEMNKLCQEMRNIRPDEVYSVTYDVLYYKGKIVVPDNNNIKLEILRSRHDSKLAGHPGRMRTLMLVKRHFHWNSMKTYINKYIDGCQSCQRVKARTNKPFGSLQPLPIPQGPWIDIC